VTPFLIGFEKYFLCHSHLGLIWISLLFSFLSEPFSRNEKEDGTLELYYLSAYCLPKILLLQLVGHWVIQISCVFCAFPMLQLLYQFDHFLFVDWLNISLGSLVLTLLCGIHSCLALGITSSSGWNSLQNLTTLPTSLPSTLSCTSIETEWFHVPLLIGYSFPFVSLFPILVSISLQDGMDDCFQRMLSRARVWGGRTTMGMGGSSVLCTCFLIALLIHPLLV
jgi:heme exporter protein CcmB